MSRFNVFIILGLLFFNNFFCQTEKVNELLVKKNYKEAIDSINSYVSQQKNMACYDEAIFNFIICYAKLKNNDSLNKYITLFCTNTLCNSAYYTPGKIALLKLFKPLHSHPLLNKTENYSDSVYLQAKASLTDPHFSLTLVKIYSEDQNIFLVDDDEVYAPFDSIYKNHEKIIINYFNTYGYPKRPAVEEHLLFVPWLVIQHSDGSLIRKYLPQIKKAAYSQLIEKEYYALTLDRLLLMQGKEQIYGTQFKPLKNGKSQLYPIKGIKVMDEKGIQVLDKRRKELGFILTIRDYIELNNIDNTLYRVAE